jgi:POT family proton-dependent oligopeptide transporter
MVIGLVVYVLTGQRLAHVGHPPATERKRPWGILGLVIIAAVLLFGIVRVSDLPGGIFAQGGSLHIFWEADIPPGGFDFFLFKFSWIRFGFVVLPVAAIIWFGTRPDANIKRIAAVLIFSLASLVFWAIFEQAGSTISLFGDQLTRTEAFGYKFPSAWFQSVNSFFVFTLAPLFALLWVKLGDRQPSAPTKFVFGLIMLGASFILMVPAAKLTVDGKVSPFWIVGLFFLQTVGELCISPVGLSTMTKLAPAKLLGLVMGIWFLATALGNKMAGVLASEFTATDGNALADFFLHQALWVGIATVVLLACVPWLKKLMGGVK